MHRWGPRWGVFRVAKGQQGNLVGPRAEVAGGFLQHGRIGSPVSSVNRMLPRQPAPPPPIHQNNVLPRVNSQTWAASLPPIQRKEQSREARGDLTIDAGDKVLRHWPVPRGHAHSCCPDTAASRSAGRVAGLRCHRCKIAGVSELATRISGPWPAAAAPHTGAALRSGRAIRGRCQAQVAEECFFG